MPGISPGAGEMLRKSKGLCSHGAFILRDPSENRDRFSSCAKWLSFLDLSLKQGLGYSIVTLSLFLSFSPFFPPSLPLSLYLSFSFLLGLGDGDPNSLP